MNKWLTVSIEQRDFYLLIDIVSLDLLPPANEVLAKVIFLEGCIKNSVHAGGGGGRGVLSQHALQVVFQHALQEVSRGVCSWGVPGLVWGVPGPWGVPHSGGVCYWGGAWWRPPTPQDGYCCRQYASYWNVFLFDLGDTEI